MVGQGDGLEPDDACEPGEFMRRGLAVGVRRVQVQVHRDGRVKDLAGPGFRDVEGFEGGVEGVPGVGDGGGVADLKQGRLARSVRGQVGPRVGSRNLCHAACRLNPVVGDDIGEGISRKIAVLVRGRAGLFALRMLPAVPVAVVASRWHGARGVVPIYMGLILVCL